MKIKITQEGQPCHKCGTPVKRKDRPNDKTKAGQKVYFKYWFYCPGCKSMYMVESAKVYIDESQIKPKPLKPCRCEKVNYLCDIYDSENNLINLGVCADCGKVFA